MKLLYTQTNFGIDFGVMFKFRNSIKFFFKNRNYCVYDT